MAQTKPNNNDVGRSSTYWALNLFYTTKVYQQLSDPKYGLQLMSDDYILENLIEELRETQ